MTLFAHCCTAEEVTLLLYDNSNSLSPFDANMLYNTFCLAHSTS